MRKLRHSVQTKSLAIVWNCLKTMLHHCKHTILVSTMLLDVIYWNNEMENKLCEMIWYVDFICKRNIFFKCINWTRMIFQCIIWGYCMAIHVWNKVNLSFVCAMVRMVMEILKNCYHKTNFCCVLFCFVIKQQIMDKFSNWFVEITHFRMYNTLCTLIKRTHFTNDISLWLCQLLNKS